jgi:hypothetical protein
MTPTREAILSLCAAAGVTADEIINDPELGICVNLPGARKLARVVPNKANAVRIIELLEEVDKARKGNRP